MVVAQPVTKRASFLKRWRAMAHVGVKMMFHDKLKMLGTLAGVVFAVILSNQQAGTFLGLLGKNTMFVDNAGADLWIVPKSTQTLQPGQLLSEATLMQARVTPGIAWAEPLLYGGASVQLPSGGTEAVTLIGTRFPAYRGGPWNVVAGEREALALTDTMVFEDSERKKLGGLNIGSVREVNGHSVRVGAFTWGLLPFAPAYAFAEYDLARELLHTSRDQMNFVLVGVAPGQDAAAVKRDLQARVPEALVLTKAEFRVSIIRYLLFNTGIGITFGTSTIFGLIVGFVIVALSMFSAVVDNVREYGTLKALGATTFDLAKLLWMQAVLYGAIGSLIGLAFVSQIANAARSPQLAMVLPPEMMLGTAVVMVGMCLFASTLALMRLRKVEPAMVFR